MQSLRAGITVVIPCLNEEGTIARAIAEAKEGIEASGFDGEVVVADNGSMDDSPKLATEAGARVLPVERRGYGAALNAGISSAKFRFVVFADADLSYPFLELANLIAPLHSGKADLVLGTRLCGNIKAGAMPTLNRYLGTPVLSWFIRRIYRIPTSDCNSGMRALLRETYDDLALMCPGMEFASEMLIRAAEKNWRYAEVPITFRKDQRVYPTHMKRWRDGWRHLRFILGNGDSIWLMGLPAGIGFFFLAVAFCISLMEFLQPQTRILFHTAFGCIVLSMPFVFFASSQLLVKSTFYLPTSKTSRFLDFVHRCAENSYPFYLAMTLYGLALLQLGWLFIEWYRVGFGDLYEIGGVIRVTVLAILATVVFSLDMALGLLRLIPYSNKN